jgi:hypothetical protein
MAMSRLKSLGKRELLIWAEVISLALCLIYLLFYLSSSLGFSLIISSNRSMVPQSSVLFGPLDVAVWGIAIFVILVLLGYDLELNLLRGYYRSFVGLGFLVAICGMAIGVCLVAVGFVGFIGLVPISILLLVLCVIFSPDFFSLDRVPFILRLVVSMLIVGILVELGSFLV